MALVRLPPPQCGCLGGVVSVLSLIAAVFAAVSIAFAVKVLSDAFDDAD